MDFLAQWRHWIRPFFVCLYFVLAIIALPLCIIELEQENAPTHVEAWFAGGIFVLCGIPISLWGILQHLVNYTQPNLQRHIIRILWMVPIYGINAWFALRFPDAAIYLDTLRECYEAYVIYNFMAYLLNYLWIDNPNLEITMRNKDQVRHICPFCCFPPWRMKYSFIQRCKHGALQYTIIRPLTTCIALICELCGVYNEGDFDFKSAWSYLVVINNISQVWAMYCLVLFYKAMKEELAPIKPVPKFLCVKFVVFFSFWQSVVIAILVKLDWIPQNGTWEFYSGINEVATGLQDFLICVEMFFAAVAHYFSFSHKPFISDDNEGTNCFGSFLSMWDVSDMRDDVIEHVKVIGKTVKKTVSKPLLKSGTGNERTPLLSGDTDHKSRDILASQSSADWDVASLEASERSYIPQSQTTASMSNYMDLDTEVQDEEVDTTQVIIERHSKSGSENQDQGNEDGDTVHIKSEDHIKSNSSDTEQAKKEDSTKAEKGIFQDNTESETPVDKQIDTSQHIKC